MFAMVSYSHQVKQKGVTKMNKINLMDAVRAGADSELMTKWGEQEERIIEEARVQIDGYNRYQGLKTVELNERGEGFKIPARPDFV
jgi:hypothetical protein